jgi:hypothetical protein
MEPRSVEPIRKHPGLGSVRGDLPSPPHDFIRARARRLPSIEMTVAGTGKHVRLSVVDYEALRATSHAQSDLRQRLVWSESAPGVLSLLATPEINAPGLGVKVIDRPLFEAQVRAYFGFDRPHLRGTAISATYQVLGSRYSSTTTFQWQVPVFGLTAEGAVLAGVLAAKTQAAAVALAMVGLIVALAAVAVTRRVELTAWWDRGMLDRYEEVLVPEELRLYHELNVRQRLHRRKFRLNQRVPLDIQLRIVMLAPPSFVLSLALITVSLTSLVLAIFGR